MEPGARTDVPATPQAPCRWSPALCSRCEWGVALGLPAAIALVLFGDVLWRAHAVIGTGAYTDVLRYFLPALDFGFGELRRGNLPLWNPHLFSGTPFLGTFQPALLYPPNVVYLVLPVPVGINVILAGHVALAGTGTYLWVRRRGASPWGAAFAAVLMMGSGAFFLHVYAGHVTLVCAAAWAPFVILAVEQVIETRRWPWAFAGAGAATMQLLAGYPQTVFATAIAAALYTALLLPRCRGRCMAFVQLLLIAGLPPLLGAVQLWPGIETAAESTRGEGVSYDFAGSFSFPPENLLTVLAPGFFGDSAHYWGRWFLHEMCPYLGVTGLLLLVIGLGPGHWRRSWAPAAVALVLLALAFGKYLPGFRVIHEAVPGFSAFRSPSKFLTLAVLFVTPAAAAGVDALLTRVDFHRRAAVLALALAAALFCGAAWIDSQTRAAARDEAAASPVAHFAACLEQTGEVRRHLPDAEAAAATASAVRSLLIGAACCAAVAVLLLMSRRTPWAGYALVFFGAFEVVAFALGSRGALVLRHTRLPELERFYQTHDGDYRVLQPVYANHALLARAGNIWGYDPVVLDRYAEFMAFSQGEDPAAATQRLRFVHDSRLYRMLRQQYVVGPSSEGVRVLPVRNGACLPHVSLVDTCRVLPGRDALLAALAAPDFDPQRTVLLERQPHPEPKAGATGVARIRDFSTDHLTIEAEVDGPALLLITDAYSTGWRAYPAGQSAQTHYDVLPADYVLRAIPLEAGRHTLRIEYAPDAFRVGCAVSAVSGALYALAALLVWRRGGARWASAPRPAG